MIGYKDRQPTPGETVKVHRNLADPDGTQVWSILARRDGRDVVVGHAREVVLADVEFRVRPGGHARAQATRQRNVHAFAIGRLVETRRGTPPSRRVHYSPFGTGSFTDDSGEPIARSSEVYLDHRGSVWVR